MAEKYLMLDLNDSNSLLIAEIMSNKTCKKILNMLAEKEMSESDIAKTLEIPLNTVDYNIKKMIKANLIEKTKNFFWSVKGKKIESYKLANKKIIISTKSKFKGIIPAILASGVLAAGIRQFSSYYSNRFNQDISSFSKVVVGDSLNVASEAAAPLKAIQETSDGNLFNIVFNNNPVWAWFLFGALFGIFMIWLFNINKISKLNNLKGGA